MCGRTASTLAPSNVKRACAYRDKNGNLREPVWKDAPCGGKYQPSGNIPPTAYTPVIYLNGERTLQPMLWGIIPPWHQGQDHKGHGLSTNNARIENIKESKLYKDSLTRRCVVVCDGFYEWKRDAGPVKQPYFIYAKQADGVGIEKCLDFDADPDSPDNQGEWRGPQLLKMAGIYSVWRGKDGMPVYNYTIITRESTKVFSWLHHRMPCFLPDDSAVEKWLSPTTSVNEALDMILTFLPTNDTIAWHTVNTAVGNVRNQDKSLIREVKPGPEVKAKGAASKASQNLMASWLTKKSNSSASKRPVNTVKEEGGLKQEDESEAEKKKMKSST